MAEPEQFYVLVAEGPMQSFSGIKQFVDSYIFRTPEEAEAERENFIELCCNSKDKVVAFFGLDREHIKVRVKTLKLIEKSLG